jgi:hypothetical protein
MIVKPGPVIDFLLANQKLSDPSMIDWAKVMLHAKYTTNSIGMKLEFHFIIFLDVFFCNFFYFCRPGVH